MQHESEDNRYDWDTDEEKNRICDHCHKRMADCECGYDDTEGGAKMSELPQVTIWTDGSCLGNPGPGGAAAVLHWERGKSTIVVGEAHTTNNRMEILACIVGLEVLHSRCRVTIYTDSQYVIGVMSKGWKRKANHDLLAELDELIALHDVEFVHVKGHSGDPGNEEADSLAKAEVQRQKRALAEQDGHGSAEFLLGPSYTEDWEAAYEDDPCEDADGDCSTCTFKQTEQFAIEGCRRYV